MSIWKTKHTLASLGAIVSFVVIVLLVSTLTANYSGDEPPWKYNGTTSIDKVIIVSDYSTLKYERLLDVQSLGYEQQIHLLKFNHVYDNTDTLYLKMFMDIISFYDSSMLIVENKFVTDSRYIKYKQLYPND
jgi:hypothetical protein